MLFKISTQNATIQTSSLVSAYLQNKFKKLSGKHITNLRLHQKTKLKRLLCVIKAATAQLNTNYLTAAQALINVFIIKPNKAKLEQATERLNTSYDIFNDSIQVLTQPPVKAKPFISFL